jgi:hypothetical protein
MVATCITTPSEGIAIGARLRTELTRERDKVAARLNGPCGSPERKRLRAQLAAIVALLAGGAP